MAKTLKLSHGENSCKRKEDWEGSLDKSEGECGYLYLYVCVFIRMRERERERGEMVDGKSRHK
jgi:hypothetical protein